jgi:hypothetical protein
VFRLVSYPRLKVAGFRATTTKDGLPVSSTTLALNLGIQLKYFTSSKRAEASVSAGVSSLRVMSSVGTFSFRIVNPSFLMFEAALRSLSMTRPQLAQ